MKSLLLLFFVVLIPSSVQAQTNQAMDLTFSWVGFTALGIFTVAYIFVILEEKLGLRKSKPVLIAAGLIWVLLGVYYNLQGQSHLIESAIRHNFLEYTELFFFLLVAMTYINAMLERGVFAELRNWLINKGFSYRSLFWVTGILSFFISPIADNLTTALIMCAVVMAVGEGHSKFIGIACINIVVAANAGGAFSPFGDITTLMVWQKGMIPFAGFFDLFVPSLVNYLVPAFIMQFAIAKGCPMATNVQDRALKYGGITIVFLFLLTIVTAVSLHSYLHIPPVFGMMMGLGYLKLYSFYLMRKSNNWTQHAEVPADSDDDPYNFDVFDKIAHSEWDTLFFFYGIILAVGGLGLIGYLSLTSAYLYGELGPTYANVLVGILSAIIDNIPVMFAVLTMAPDMSYDQWQLVTLTAGVGGSLLSIGSAAGVALMGQARGQYTFYSHLKWTPVIALGYGASIYCHLLINT